MKSALTNQILQIIRTHAYKADMTVSEFGRRAGVSKAWLSKLKNTDANLSIETAEKLLHVAGYKLNISKSGNATASIEPVIEKTASDLRKKKVTNKILQKILNVE